MEVSKQFVVFAGRLGDGGGGGGVQPLIPSLV